MLPPAESDESATIGQAPEHVFAVTHDEEPDQDLSTPMLTAHKQTAQSENDDAIETQIHEDPPSSMPAEVPPPAAQDSQEKVLTLDLLEPPSQDDIPASPKPVSHGEELAQGGVLPLPTSTTHEEAERASATETRERENTSVPTPLEVPVSAAEVTQKGLSPLNVLESLAQDDMPSSSIRGLTTSNNPLSQPIPDQPVDSQARPSLEPKIVESDLPPSAKETPKQRRRREAEERVEREDEEEKAEQLRFEKYRIDQERMEMARLEQKRLEKERIRRERRDQEKLEQDRLAKQRVEQERLVKERLELERRENERLEQERRGREIAEATRIDRERRLEQQQIEETRLNQERDTLRRKEGKRAELQKMEHEAVERKRLQQEAEANVRAAELARKESLEAQAEAARIHSTASPAPSEPSKRRPSPIPQRETVSNMPAEPTHLPTPHADIPLASGPPLTKPVDRLPTPATSVGRSESPRFATPDAFKRRADAPEPSPQTLHAHGTKAGNPVSHGKYTAGIPAMPVPRPQAVSLVLEESRPPAPSPPVTKARTRHVPAFDSEDESDSALVQPRRQFRGGEDDELSGAYPPQPTHHRSVFASRVPPDQMEPAYSNPPPPQPPGYHPGYYPPTAPPHYQSHNYRMSQQGYPHPNSYGPSSHSSSSPYTEPWNYPPGYRHDSPPQRHDTLVTRDYPLGLAPIDTRSAIGDDPGDVFSRIAQAIPDLHVLLARYKETHGQLSVREDLLRRSGVEQEEKLRAKDDEIAELKERTRILEHKYSTEASRLRFEVGNLEEQAREVREQRVETEKFKKEAQGIQAALDAAMKSWETKYKELEEAHTKATTRNDAEKIALAIQFDQRLKEAEVIAQNQRDDATAAYVKEKEELRSDHQRQQTERQASFDRVRNELETKLGAAQIDREEALKHERESREVWLVEREALIKSHQDERESIRRGWDEQRDLLEAQYKKTKDESDKAWFDLHADASRKAEEERARVEQALEEQEELQKKYSVLRAQSEQEKTIIKSVATNLESEKSRLEKLMECYGDIAEIKSKGDTY
jgi:serine/arginine repetitive matrix protein 2